MTRTMLRAMDRPGRSRTVRRAAIPFAPLVALLLLALAPPVRAAGPPFPDPIDGQAVYDTAMLFDAETRFKAEGIIDAIEAQTKAEVVVYTPALGGDDISPE